MAHFTNLIIPWLIAAGAHAAPPPQPSQAAQPVALQCEQRTDPEGIDTRHPRLSWQITGDGDNIRQTAWQLLVASTPEILAKDKGDLWSSPKTTSDQSRMIVYGGKSLKSGAPYYWKVRVWTTAGAAAHPTVPARPTVPAGVSAWSTPARWSMGLLDSADWKARWIGCDSVFPGDS